MVDGQRQPSTVDSLSPAGQGIVGWMRDSRQACWFTILSAKGPALAGPPVRRLADFAALGSLRAPALARLRLGAVAIQSRLPNAFDEDDLRLLSIVANQAASAFENARLFERASGAPPAWSCWPASPSASTSFSPWRPSTSRSSIWSPAHLLITRSAIMNATVSSSPCASARVASSSSSGETQPSVVRWGEGAAGQAAQLRQASYAAGPRRSRSPATPGEIRPPQLAIPVQIDERVLGVLLITGQGTTVFDESAQSVFQALAAQIAIAILEAQFYAAEQRRADQLAALAQVSRAVATTLELDDLLDEVLDVVNERFNYKCARIFLAQDDRLVYQAGIGEGTVGTAIQGLAYRLDGPGLIPLVGRTRQALRVDDVSTHADYVPGPGLASTQSEMAAPMRMGERLLGVFDVQSDTAASFTEDDARMLQALADTLAVAVRNARLFEFERRRRRLAEIMRQVSAALTATLQLDHVLDLILDGLALVVNYDAASILLVNEAGEMILQASRGAAGTEAAIGRPLPSNGLARPKKCRRSCRSARWMSSTNTTTWSTCRTACLPGRRARAWRRAFGLPGGRSGPPVPVSAGRS